MKKPIKIVQASDRQYEVNERGEYRRLKQTIKGNLEPYPEPEFHRDGMSFNGSKCYCKTCRDWRKENSK